MLTWNNRKTTARVTTVSLLAVGTCFLSAPSSANDDDHYNDNYGDAVQVGARPYYLINKMSPSQGARPTTRRR